LAPLFAGALFDQRVGRGTVWMLDDARSVALWDGPGAVDPRVATAAWAPFERQADAGARDRLTAYDAALDAAAPSSDFWYLGVLATRPEGQGQGLATRVMTPGLAAADRDGLAACLETSTEGNRAFYRRRGFTETTVLDLPGAPPTWWLRRPVGALAQEAPPQ
jgi:GNAT superfamily N-acetyltransferase